MHVVVATHGHCFDGLASAVVFTRLMSKVEGSGTAFTYRACGYGEGQLTPTDDVLSGDQNAVLDYRFAPTERLTWYFDHHRTAFANDRERDMFAEKRPTGRFFYEPAYTSCTKLVCEVAAGKFGVSLAGLDDLVHWADVIDSAAFKNPDEALDRSNPVMRLAAVVERYGDDKLLAELVPKLLEQPLPEIARLPEVEKRYAKIAGHHERFVERVRARAVRKGRVVVVDLTDEVLEMIGKFVTYALYPDAVYSVIVGLMKNATKISVGYNPWSGKPCDVDISAICARYGGGGHPFVGAVQFGKNELDRARKVALEIAEELAG
ncbi:MAG TPA: hypothetical protein VH062_37300 [Polyangiaceae bacterium]|jgi:hypothetical protein|nr:hypothetical protein [Polyangiaceae bacterium]